MIVDSSAILAIALQEPEAARFAAAIANAPDRFISTVNWLETMMVIESRIDVTAAGEAALILNQLGVKPLPFDEAHMQDAYEAWQRYGKGRHPAALESRRLLRLCSVKSGRPTAPFQGQ